MIFLDVISEEYSRSAFNLWLPLVAILILLTLFFKRWKIALFLFLILPIIYFVSKYLDEQDNISIQKNNHEMRERDFKEEQSRKKLQKEKDSLEKVKLDSKQDSLKK